MCVPRCALCSQPCGSTQVLVLFKCLDFSRMLRFSAAIHLLGEGRVCTQKFAQVYAAIDLYNKTKTNKKRYGYMISRGNRKWFVDV